MLCSLVLSASQPVANPNEAVAPYDNNFAAKAASGSWGRPSAGAIIGLERKKRTSSCCPPKWCLCDDVLTAPRITVDF